MSRFNDVLCSRHPTQYVNAQENNVHCYWAALLMYHALDTGAFPFVTEPLYGCIMPRTHDPILQRTGKQCPLLLRPFTDVSFSRHQTQYFNVQESNVHCYKAALLMYHAPDTWPNTSTYRREMSTVTEPLYWCTMLTTPDPNTSTHRRAMPTVTELLYRCFMLQIPDPILQCTGEQCPLLLRRFTDVSCSRRTIQYFNLQESHSHCYWAA